MPGAGAARVSDIEDYQARWPYPEMQLTVTETGAFDARLTWAKLPNVLFLSTSETLSRVAYISLPAKLLVLSFAAGSFEGLRCNGIEVLPGCIMAHRGGEKVHHRVIGPSRWGLLAFTSRFLVAYGSALSGKTLILPQDGQMTRPSPRDAAKLLRLHTRVARMVETSPVAVGEPDVGRAVEDELLRALVPCLVDAQWHEPSKTQTRHAAIVKAFEAYVEARSREALSMRDVCTHLAVSDRTLRNCCLEVLGTTPAHYAMLRRLRLTRAAIRQADPALDHVGEIAKRFGFAEPGRFAAAYRMTFGESPSTTLRQLRSLSA